MTPPPKQKAILSVGRVLFLRNGITKVRVEEICADAGVSKRTFYKYFHDKDALAVAVLSELFKEGRALLEGILDLDCSIEEKARRVIAAKTELASQTSAVFYRESIDEATQAGRFALEEQRKWDERVRRFYRETQARGQIRRDIDVDLLMAVLVRLRDIVAQPELLRLVPDWSRLVETVMMMVFYGIVPRPTEKERRKPRKTRRAKS
jgi:AcrR family transcriptional regulator